MSVVAPIAPADAVADVIIDFSVASAVADATDGEKKA
jgi:hypothetical protein